MKDPNLGKLGFYAGKVKFGESFFFAASRCLLAETGLTAEFEFVGQIHLTVGQENEIETDVIFSCFKAIKFSGELIKQTALSQNEWVKLSKLGKTNDFVSDFDQTREIFENSQLKFIELFVGSNTKF